MLWLPGQKQFKIKEKGTEFFFIDPGKQERCLYLWDFSDGFYQFIHV
jgi:hypothetical protein